MGQDHSNDAIQIPQGSAKTEMVGGTGGGPYLKVSKDRQDVIGFTIRIGHWAGHPVLGRVDPLYEAPANMNPPRSTVCLAKPGYVVGGIVVGDQDGAAGMSVIFVKKTATGVDVSDTYSSPWFGYDEGTKHTLAGHGERVIGTFGRQGHEHGRHRPDRGARRVPTGIQRSVAANVDSTEVGDLNAITRALVSFAFEDFERPRSIPNFDRRGHLW